MTTYPRLRRWIKVIVRSIAHLLAGSVDVLMRLLGPCLGLLATGIIATCAYNYFTIIAPLLLNTYQPVEVNFITFIGLWLLGNLYFNYFSTMFTSPGIAPQDIDEETKALQIDDPERQDGKNYRFCRRCNCVKPMRSHHCSICNKCVLKMDHHCPWVNNCVGYANHRHFILFLTYLWSASIFYLATCFQESRKALLTGRGSSSTFLFTIIMAFSASIATSAFLFWNIYLLVSNQTTIEFYGNFCGEQRADGIRNVYHLGYLRNIKEVFGEDVSIFTWFLPSWKKPPGNGLVYQLCTQDVKWAARSKPPPPLGPFPLAETEDKGRRLLRPRTIEV